MKNNFTALRKNWHILVLVTLVAMFLVTGTVLLTGCDANGNDTTNTNDPPPDNGNNDPNDPPPANGDNDPPAQNDGGDVSNPPTPPENLVGFPVLNIDNIGGRPLQEHGSFNRTDWRDVNVTVSNAPADSILNNVAAQMRGRGNSSWNADKRSFRLRFNHANVTMPGADHVARDWTFIANHRDYSLMRHYSAYHLAGLLDGYNTTPFTQFTHVYFNGAYQGVYMISIHVPEPVNHGTGRISATRNPTPALSEFIIEYQLRYRLTREPHLVEGQDWFTLRDNRSYRIRYGGTSTAHHNYVRDFIRRVDNAFMARDMNTLRQLVCMDSFVDFYVLQELFRDSDSARASIFMQILGTGENRRLYMGPAWDFDHAAAGSSWSSSSHPYHILLPNGIPEDRQGFTGNPRPGAYRCDWSYSLLQVPEFREAVAARLIEVRDNYLPQTTAHLLHMADFYRADFARNFQRWNILGGPVNQTPWIMQSIMTHRGQVEWLAGWLTIRMDYLVGYYNNHSPYFNIGNSSISDITASVGTDVTLFDFELTAENLPSHITSVRFDRYEVVRINPNGTNFTLRRGNLNGSQNDRINFTINNAQLGNSGTHRLIVHYTVQYRFSNACPGYTVSLDQPFGDIVLTVN